MRTSRAENDRVIAKVPTIFEMPRPIQQLLDTMSGVGGVQLPARKTHEFTLGGRTGTATPLGPPTTDGKTLWQVRWNGVTLNVALTGQFTDAQLVSGSYVKSRLLGQPEATRTVGGNGRQSLGVLDGTNDGRFATQSLIVPGGIKHLGNRWLAGFREVLDAQVAPDAQRYLKAGNALIGLRGTDLQNYVGVAMGVAPNVLPVRGAGNQLLYQGEALQAIGTVSDAIRAAGGTQPQVRAVPVYLRVADDKMAKTTIFRVQGRDGGERIVDNVGRTYESLQKWKQGNQLGAVDVFLPQGGRLQGRDGQVVLEAFNNRRFDNTALPVLRGGVAILGAGAGVAVMLGSGGAAAPLVMAGGAVLSVVDSGATLADRARHGQTLALTNQQARAAWLDLGAGLLGAGAIGTGSKVLARASDLADLLTLGNGVRDLRSEWDKLGPGERVLAGAQLAFWASMLGASQFRGGRFNLDPLQARNGGGGGGDAGTRGRTDADAGTSAQGTRGAGSSPSTPATPPGERPFRPGEQRPVGRTSPPNHVQPPVDPRAQLQQQIQQQSQQVFQSGEFRQRLTQRVTPDEVDAIGRNPTRLLALAQDVALTAVVERAFSGSGVPEPVQQAFRGRAEAWAQQQVRLNGGTTAGWLEALVMDPNASGHRAELLRPVVAEHLGGGNDRLKRAVEAQLRPMGESALKNLTVPGRGGQPQQAVIDTLRRALGARWAEDYGLTPQQLGRLDRAIGERLRGKTHEQQRTELVELASSNATRTAMVRQATREPATTAVAEPRLVPVDVVPAGSALPGLGKESALRNVTPPKGNGAGAVKLGAEVQVLRGFSVGKDLSSLLSWLTGQDPSLRTRLGPVELLGGGYATATLELGDLERGLPGGNPRQTDPKSTRIKRPGATDAPAGQLLPDDPNGPSARWKAFAIATGPTWPGRDGNDAQYTWRLGLGDALGKEYGPTNVLVDYGMARNNVQRVDFDLYGDRGALATGAVKNTRDARMPLQLNVIDIGGGNVKFAGPVPLPVRVQSATSLPAALLRNLPAAGSEVWEWTEPARRWLQGLGLDGVSARQLIDALRQQPWASAVGGGAEGVASRLPNVKAKFSANVSIAPGQVLPRGLVDELNRQLNPQTPVFKQAGSITDGYRLQVRTDLPPGVRGFDFPVSGVRDFMHALIPPSQWGALTTKLEFEFPLPIPMVGFVPIVTVTAKPAKLAGSAGAWRTVGEGISKLNPSSRYAQDALGRTPLAEVEIPLSNLLLRHPDGTSLSVVAVRETPSSPWDASNAKSRLEVASFVPGGNKPPQPDTPSYLLFTASRRIAIVPHSVVHALDGHRPLTAAVIRSLQQQATVWDQPEQNSIRTAYLRFAAGLREGQKLNDAQVQQLVEFVKLGLGRRPMWPADPSAPPNPREVPNVNQRVPSQSAVDPPTIDVDPLR